MDVSGMGAQSGSLMHALTANAQAPAASLQSQGAVGAGQQAGSDSSEFEGSENTVNITI